MSRVAALCIVAASLPLLGCGPKAPEGVFVYGRLLKGDKPLEIPKRDSGQGVIELRLSPLGEGPAETTYVEKEGKFTFPGPAERGIPSGMYKLAVYLRDEGTESDALNGKFSVERTNITLFIADDPGGEQDIGKIDLDKY